MEAKQVSPAYAQMQREYSGNGPLLNLVLAVVVALLWSFWPCLCAVLGAVTLPAASHNVVFDGSEQMQLELQRGVQKHFLIYGVYVPLEDILFTQRLAVANKELEPVLRKTCGNSRFALWLPLIVRIPLVGERSSEWCWNIALKK